MLNERNAHGDRPGRRLCPTSLGRRLGEALGQETAVDSAAALVTKTEMGPADSSTEFASFAKDLDLQVHYHSSAWVLGCYQA